MAALVAESETPRPFLEQIAGIERQREALQAELETVEAEQQSAGVLRTISQADIRKLLAGIADHIDQVDRGALKDMLAGMIERVELDAGTMAAQVHYRIGLADALASPRRTQDIRLRIIRQLIAA